MGVTRVCPWPLSSGKSGQQVVDVLQKNVELAGAQWTGSWCVDCETYQSVSSMGSPAKILHIVHSTEFPMSTFASLENGSCLVADKGFDSVVPKLKGFYEPRKGAKIEVLYSRCQSNIYNVTDGLAWVVNSTNQGCDNYTNKFFVKP